MRLYRTGNENIFQGTTDERRIACGGYATLIISANTQRAHSKHPASTQRTPSEHPASTQQTPSEGLASAQSSASGGSSGALRVRLPCNAAACRCCSLSGRLEPAQVCWLLPRLRSPLQKRTITIDCAAPSISPAGPSLNAQRSARLPV